MNKGFVISVCLGLILLQSTFAISQNAADSTWSEEYRAAKTRYFDLLHTKLNVSFDWEQQYLLGEAWLKLKPYFFATDVLELDAKGMEVQSVQLWSDSPIELEYKYDGKVMLIDLRSEFTRSDTIEVYVKYVSKPNEIVTKGSAAITSDKGLYFINADGSDPDKPKQIWTQGETESSSVWFPTIDAPNERCTQEISITVDSVYNTLSNGVLISQKNNEDGTRTDYWKMDLPHAPYLFMMAIGEYSVVKDKWKNVPIAYHVEPAYESFAKSIFGNTPEMMTYFSELLNYPYPWPNYDQVVVRDYVSGAMENTTSSIFMEQLQLNDRELEDFNWDDIIAHELFHQWFGDLVTCESWSNLTLNEGFASYSEYLWDEHKYGKDEADYNLMVSNEQYFAEATHDAKNLIRYFYADKEDMFDGHSYNKGAGVLHMLRSYLGDDAFFAGLNRYLTDNAFKSAELANLRLAFEEVCGEDLNWFFDQWFFFPGHPDIEVEHTFNNDTLSVKVSQVQGNPSTPTYRLPVFIDIWSSGQKKSYPVVVEEPVEVYQFHMTEAPELVIFDSERQLLAEIRHPLTDEEMVFQFNNDASLYGRMEVMDSLSNIKSKKLRTQIVEQALKDPYTVIRQYGIQYLIDEKVKIKKYELEVAQLLTDKSSHVRALALAYAGAGDFEAYESTIRRALDDKSYMVVGAALTQIFENDNVLSADQMTTMAQENNINIVLPLASYYIKQEDEKSFQWFEEKLGQITGNDLYYFLSVYSEKLMNAGLARRKASVQRILEIAKKESSFGAKLGVYQALMLLADIDGVKEILKDIKENETNEQLREWYDQL